MTNSLRSTWWGLIYNWVLLFSSLSFKNDLAEFQSTLSFYDTSFTYLFLHFKNIHHLSINSLNRFSNYWHIFGLVYVYCYYFYVYKSTISTMSYIFIDFRFINCILIIQNSRLLKFSIYSMILFSKIYLMPTFTHMCENPILI